MADGLTLGNPFSGCGQRPGRDPARRPAGPHFLVVSPPKTGSTWLADNLRCHPGVFVPAVKELKYFSSLYRCVGPGWYRDQFAAATGRVAGEASPSYAALPAARIRTLRRRWPELKVVFLMRDPVGRAWSHAKHTRRYREAAFAGRPADGPVTDADWRAALDDDWVAVAGDYLGHLRRWRAAFPARQLYVGFYESIAADPVGLLRDVFAFLGVDPGVDLSGFPVRERILAGPPGELSPPVRAHLHARLHARTTELAAYLRAEFGLVPPPGWAETLRPPPGPSAGPVAAFAREGDDAYLADVLSREASFPTAHARVLDAYLGYDLAYVRGRLLAVARTVGPADLPAGLPGATGATLRRLAAAGDCLTAPTLAGLKERVARHVAARAEARAERLEAALAEARERLARAEAEAFPLTAGERRWVEQVLMVRRRLGAVRRRVRRWAAWLKPSRVG